MRRRVPCYYSLALPPTPRWAPTLAALAAIVAATVAPSLSSLSLPSSPGKTGEDDRVTTKLRGRRARTSRDRQTAYRQADNLVERHTASS
eukprot:scaffold96576_cov63-Phaeocystis_antarctica.AAC.1